MDITEYNALDRVQWRKWIHVTDPNYLGLRARFDLVNGEYLVR